MEHAPRLRSELHKTLSDAPLEFREQITRTALLSRREALRALDEAAETRDDLSGETVERARALIEQYAAA